MGGDVGFRARRRVRKVLRPIRDEMTTEHACCVGPSVVLDVRALQRRSLVRLAHASRYFARARSCFLGSKRFTCSGERSPLVLTTLGLFALARVKAFVRPDQSRGFLVTALAVRG